MFRWLGMTLLLCAGCVVLMWFFSDTYSGGEDPLPSIQSGPESSNPSPVDIKFHPKPVIPFLGREATLAYGRIEVIERQDVPSEAGKTDDQGARLLFLGTPVQPTNPNKTCPLLDAVIREQLFPELEMKIAEGNYYREKLGFLVTEVREGEEFKPEQCVVFPDNPKKKYRYTAKGEPLNPNQVRVAQMEFLFKKLEVGDEVKKDQLVGLADPVLALDDLVIKATKFQGAEADRMASEKTRDETRKRYDSINRQYAASARTVSLEDLRGAELTWQRYVQEEVSKGAALRQAEREIESSVTVLRKYEIKSTINGVIRAFYKNRGDAVRKLDPVMQVQNLDRLRVEGMVELQQAFGLKWGQRATVEPSQPQSPKLVIGGHSLEINCVAVTRGSPALILSGSEDRTLRCWNSETGQAQWDILHKSAIKAVACTGPKAQFNLALTGAADGTARLINLDKIKPDYAPVVLAGEHSSAINAVAFHPNGSLCATGGEDRSIVLWKVAVESDGEIKVAKLHAIPSAHRASITGLQFTPKGDHLISAGQDFFLTVWKIEADKLPVRDMEFDRRSGDVGVLGTDGQRVLIDRGKEIELRGLKDKQLEGRLRNPPGAGNFTNMALFSPDGKTILTNGAADGRLQLWRTPEHKGRGAEIRQLIWTGTGAVSCGAFSPDGKFVVTGTKDNYVLVWAMPSAEEVNYKLFARLTLVERVLDDSSRMVRVWAELETPGEVNDPAKKGKNPDWLVPGQSATMVIWPDESK